MFAPGLNKLSFSVKLVEYIFSAVKVISSYPCVGPSPRIRISFFLMSTSAEELISTPNVIQFLPNPLPTANFPDLPNPIPYPQYF